MLHFGNRTSEIMTFKGIVKFYNINQVRVSGEPIILSNTLLERTLSVLKEHLYRKEK